MTGIIQKGDKEAQFNALTIAITLKNLDIVQSLLRYIYQKHGGLILNDLTDYIMKKNISLAEKKQKINAFKMVMRKIKSMHNIK